MQEVWKTYANKLSANNYYKYGTFSSCNKCHPYSCSSHAEKEIVDFIKTICQCTILTNKRTIIPNSELDIYIPDKKLAIEYDGMYWHSAEMGTSKSYHLNKTQLCEKANIQLIHLFESEWMHKREIVKSMLKSIFSIYDETLNSSNCEIVEINSSTAIQFLNENHIRGSIKANINIGLIANNELVSVMSIRKSRFNKSCEWEIVRFCNRINCQVIGSEKKMLAYFEATMHPISIIGYVDRRWGNGDVYKQLGFTLDHISPPNYWYWNYGRLDSRMKFQKRNLKSILKEYDPNLSNAENIKANGYKKIYDCGNLVFIKRYNSISILKEQHI